jgi:putative ABC transport system permease protein
MFLRYYLEETYQNLRQNKLRSLLTGFGVAWGIFLLVILLGVGEGFYRGVFRKFSGYSQNAIWCWGQSFKGKNIRFTLPLLNQLKAHVKGIEHVSPVNGGYQSYTLRYMAEDYDGASVKGVEVCYNKIGQLELSAGRFLNERDKSATRPVCVIGSEVQSNLFAKEDPIGKQINVNGHYFQVVGTLDKEASFNNDEHKAVLIPFSTFCKVFNWGTDFWNFRASLWPGAAAEAVEGEVRSYLASQLGFDQSDKRAVYIFNLGKQAKKFDDLFDGVRIFLWIIGGCMLLSGIMGVSNMVLVSVKERTQEIGIRKVVGASAKEILIMVLLESIFICLTAGMAGMLAGVSSIYALNKLLDYVDPAQELLIGHLELKMAAVVAALLLLVVCGAIAGIFPAKKATSILPIKALNTE